VWSPTGSTGHVGHQLACCTYPGWLWGWRIWWNDDWQGKPKYSEKTCPRATSSTTNPTWPDRARTRAATVHEYLISMSNMHNYASVTTDYKKKNRIKCITRIIFVLGDIKVTVHTLKCWNLTEFSINILLFLKVPMNVGNTLFCASYDNLFVVYFEVRVLDSKTVSWERLI
jgi:hypothetical protein